MKLRYRNAARIDLESFINHYREAFRTLYSDTGLWNEDLIIEGYERSALQLYDAINAAIRLRIGKNKVIGRKQVTSNWFEAHVSAASRTIFVLYSEEKTTNTRWVESISIDRKPIIF